jgi:hypothetical protein
MKKYVMSNTIYKKHSQFNGSNGHNKRLFAENKHSFPEYVKYNFGTDDLEKRYLEIHERHKNSLRKKMTGKENTFIECVVAFSLEKFEELERELTREQLQEKLSFCMDEYLTTLKNNFGFEPVGFTFHLDEGVMDEETGILRRNVHAHAIAYNYDFKKNVAPLRKMNKSDFSAMQDLVAASFGPLGFERGISKEITDKNHLERDEFIKQLQAEKEKEIEQKNQEIQQLKTVVKKGNLKVESLKNEVKTEKKKLAFLGQKITEIAAAMPQLFSSIFALDTPNVIYWSKVIAGAIPSKKIKDQVVESLDNLAEYSHEYATEMCQMIDTSKENIENEFLQIQQEKKQLKKSPGMRLKR